MSDQAQQVLESRLTVNEAATQACVHPTTIRRWIYNDILPHTRTRTGRIRIDPADLMSVLSLSTETTGR